MVSQVVEIVNETGLHTRPGNQFVKKAKGFRACITVRKGEREADGKSLLKLMKIGVSQGDQVEIICEGEGEQQALASLVEFIKHLEG